MKILFCNIAWMKYYKGTQPQDIPLHGGSYVDLNQDANESSNFLPYTIWKLEGYEPDTDYCFGIFKRKRTSGSKVNQVHIENINGCELMVVEPFVDGVLMIV